MMFVNNDIMICHNKIFRQPDILLDFLPSHFVLAVTAICASGFDAFFKKNLQTQKYLKYISKTIVY